MPLVVDRVAERGTAGLPLNAEQRRAVECPSRRLAVLAGAGTGKTATLIARVERLVAEGVSPSGILLLTFTRRAAEEMRRRAAGAVPDAGRIWAGTFHSIAARLLRGGPSSAFRAPPDFTVIDEADSRLMMGLALNQRGFARGDLSPEEILAEISYARNAMVPLEDHLPRAFGDRGHAIGAAWQILEAQKRAMGVLDYDDLLERWLEGLASPDIVDLHRRRWRHVLVDEFQDNNSLQGRILRAIRPDNLLVVGDLNQSIYAFRGANPEQLSSALRSRAWEIVTLGTNYRSGWRILDFANRMMRDSAHAVTLRAPGGGPGRLSTIPFANVYTEAAGAARWAAARLRHDPAGSIAFLARASYILQPLEIALVRLGVRFEKWEGVQVAEKLEVKALCALLRLALNRRDMPAWQRALQLYDGIGEGIARRFAERICFPSMGSEDLFGFDSLPGELARFGAAPLLELAGSGTSTDPAAPAVDRAMVLLRPRMERLFPEDHLARGRTLAALRASVSSGVTLGALVDQIVVSPDAEEEPPPEAGAPGPRVLLTTIHSAKGLEWDRVWVVGAGDGQIPHPRCSENVAEERRLLYVAVTRARKELTVSWPMDLSAGRPQEPSRFLPLGDGGPCAPPGCR